MFVYYYKHQNIYQTVLCQAMASLYTKSIRQLGTEKSLKTIFKTLQNQTREIFRGDYNAPEESKSITTCLKNLGQILPDDEEYLEELESFILNGISNISRNYESDSQSVTPAVLNFLMTAIRSYNHIRGTPYRVDLDRFQTLSETGNAFLTQVLIPHIDADALHVFPPDAPLVFEISIKPSKQVFTIRSPSPLHGNRVGSLSTAVSFSKALKNGRRYRRTNRKNSAKPGESVANSDSGSSSDSDGGRGGGRRKTNKRTQYSIRRRKSKKKLIKSNKIKSNQIKSNQIKKC